MNRKRGAQPGNQNHYKHGFYSSQFKAAERRVLGRMTLTDLAGEIELMRIETRRFMQAQAGLPDDLDFETRMSALRAITLSIESINSLIRTQYILARSGAAAEQARVDETLAALAQIPDDELDPDD